MIGIRALDRRGRVRSRSLCGSAIVLPVVVFVSSLVLPGIVWSEDLASQLRVDRYEIDATFAPQNGSMEAACTIRFDPTSLPEPSESPSTDAPASVVFYLHDQLSIDSLQVGGRTASFQIKSVDYRHSYTTKANRVTVSLTPEHDLREGMVVSYSGVFTPSAARSPSDYMRIDSDGVLLRAYGYSLWFPVFLDSGDNSYRVSFPKVVIRVPDPFVPVFVGNRVREEIQGGRRVSEWRAGAVDLYAVQLTARRFHVTSRDGVFLYHDGSAASQQAGKQITAYAKDLNRLFSTHYNPSRGFDQIHVMQMPKFGDISSGNVIGMTDWNGFGSDEWSKRVLAHEFVHPFVQVPTDRSDKLFAFVIEGFPSYFHLPVLAELDGEASYEAYLARMEQSYLKKRRTGKGWRDRVLPPEKALYDLSPGDISIYKDMFVLNDRALLFFDYLRRKSGKQAFFQFTRKLFGRADLNSAVFESLVQDHFGISNEDLRLWLQTTEFPDRFRRASGD